MSEHEALCKEQVASRVTLMEADLFADYEHAVALLRDVTLRWPTDTRSNKAIQSVMAHWNRENGIIGWTPVQHLWTEKNGKSIYADATSTEIITVAGDDQHSSK